MQKLNVGGKVFCTSVDTLTSSEHDEINFFTALFDPEKQHVNNADRDGDDIIFIDRSPIYFDYVLNYLRDGVLQEHLSKKILCGILAEASFFSISVADKANRKQISYSTV